MEAHTPVSEAARAATSPEDVPLPVDDGSASEEVLALPSPIPGSPVATRAMAATEPGTPTASSLGEDTTSIQDSSTGDGRLGEMEIPARHNAPFDRLLGFLQA